MSTAAELDALISLLKEDLKALELARAIATRHSGEGRSISSVRWRGRPGSMVPAAELSGAAWKDAMREMLSDGEEHSLRDLIGAATEKSLEPSYTATVAFLKREVDGGRMARASKGMYKLKK